MGAPLAPQPRVVRVVALLVLVLGSAPAAAAKRDPLALMAGKSVAYFSLEMASPELRGQRTGGLGVLAMDLVRGEARDFAEHGASVLGVTLLYDHPWAQRIDANGEQSFDDVVTRPSSLRRNGKLKLVDHFQVEIFGAQRRVAVYEETLGKAKVLRLYSPGITRMLYIGSREARLAQELLLARAGLLAIKRRGVTPDILHLNESHCAFVGPMARDDAHFQDSVIVATSHTPVEAGLERFDPSLWPKTGLAARWKPFFERANQLDLTQAMMRVAEVTNAVSDEHTEVMKRMYPEFADRIVSVQNGVDPEFWQHPSVATLRDPRARELWNVKQGLRRTFAAEVQRRTGVALDLRRPIVAFTRRVTEYKNALPLLRDHIKQICRDRDKGGLGMQVVIAGVAHPDDKTGREWIKEFVALSKDPELKGRFVFVPDYLGPNTDLELDRTAVQGSDVWLTTAKLGLEASGTSDRRAVLNLTIPIWSPDTGGGRDYITPFQESSGVGNGFFIAPYDGDGLYTQLARVSKLFYDHTEGRDHTYLKLLTNVYRSIPRVSIARNVRLQVARTYLPALQGRRIKSFTTTGPPRSQRFDQPLEVKADLGLDGLDPSAMKVDLVWGPAGRMRRVTQMRLSTAKNGQARFVARVEPLETGEHQLVVRVPGRSSAQATVDVTADGLSEDQIQQLTLARFTARNAPFVRDPTKLLGGHKIWEFTDAQKEGATELRPYEPLIVRNSAPFTLLSGLEGRRGDVEAPAVRIGNQWIAVLRPGAGRRWMTFHWDLPGGGRYEGRNYQLNVAGPRYRSARAATR